MRFWITKNGEVSVREQIVRQVLAAILGDDLPPGSRLPSIRALARRCRIHSNTVGAAYRQLLDQGWLETRRGSGVYVRRGAAGRMDSDDLDEMLARFLDAAGRRGYANTQVLDRLRERLEPAGCRKRSGNRTRPRHA